MPLFSCDFFSSSLQMAVSMNVILPDDRARYAPGAIADDSHRQRRYRTLYLLHGLSDDHTTWLRRTSIERYADAAGIAVVMPGVHRSFYTDMAEGPAYWTFVSEEVPAFAQAYFPLSADREDNFVAGLSMGGYGAFKLAMRRPDRFAAGPSLSGALDVRSEEVQAILGSEYRRIFGGDPERMALEGDDLLAVAERLASSGEPRPKLFQMCGTEDFLYADNRKFLEHARKSGLDVTYEEGPGDHEWGYWDAGIRRVLEWLPPAKS